MLIGTVLALTLAAAYTSLLVVQRQQALGEVSRYNTTWLVSQAVLEVSQLQGAAIAALVPDSGIDEEDVRLWLDIVSNRVQLFNDGDVARFVATSPELGEIVERFRRLARAGQEGIDEPLSPERLKSIFTASRSLNVPLLRLASKANAHGGELVAQDQRQLSNLHWLFAALLGALTLCALALIGALGWHNRRLFRAQSEVEQQNKVLQWRDDELRAQNAHITFLAHHDALTGLPNRVMFNERLMEALEAHRHGAGFALLCLDLDHFKEVNDALGHPMGDELLKAVAIRLRSCVREGDVVARLGGDEFAILQHGPKFPELAQVLAARIVQELSAPFDLDGNCAVVGTSIGIAIVNHELSSADTLLRSADLALYRAKAEGRGTFCFFEQSMNDKVQARRAIEVDLRTALVRDELEVFYQPLFHLSAGQVGGFEALVRWRHPTRGLVSPAQFIPIAEELGLIVPLGEWVMIQACKEAVTWPRDIKVAVNLSPAQFRSNGLSKSIRRALNESGLPAGRLELEITESALLQDSEAVLATLHELRSLGIRIALDDFGTGYSSLSYLRSFPFDKLKIDQSFVREMGYRPDCQAIVVSVLGLAAELGMATTAEGVETEEQLEQLREFGCTEAQGYLFDRPRPAGEIRHWFAAKANTLPRGKTASLQSSLS
ncbi:putative bifunctional diguanylate cyclase/phosphodiesterase [Muricoccus vinaceus]|uniref:Bifunctional diguanylate cyclase/phosphodiesterase n=1 Tax=Muricoccus vinaceus TaxID=424704 RepID=A0ABV6IQX7_9PROT